VNLDIRTFKVALPQGRVGRGRLSRDSPTPKAFEI